MGDWIILHEASIRLTAFVGVLLVMMVWEYRSPARKLQHPRWLRWSSNLGIVVINTAMLRFLLPVLAVGSALWATENNWGWLNQMPWPQWVEILIAFLLLDMAIYLQHVLVHAVPLFWRFHRMHHADLDFDATTGLRFHPLEILFSMGLKMLIIIAIGAPVLAVILFEIALSGGAVFNHSNVRLAGWLEPWVRAIIVTPDMHRVHHSALPTETNANYGFSLSIWDRLFGTYVAQPTMGHSDMTIGLHSFRQESDLYLHRMLIQPIHSPAPTDSEPNGDLVVNEQDQ